MDEGGAMTSFQGIISGSVFSYQTQQGCRRTAPTGSTFAPDRCNRRCSEWSACDSSLRVEACRRADAVGPPQGSKAAQPGGSRSDGPRNTRNAAGAPERGVALQMSCRCERSRHFLSLIDSFLHKHGMYHSARKAVTQHSHWKYVVFLLVVLKKKKKKSITSSPNRKLRKHKNCKITDFVGWLVAIKNWKHRMYLIWRASIIVMFRQEVWTDLCCFCLT